MSKYSIKVGSVAALQEALGQGLDALMAIQDRRLDWVNGCIGVVKAGNALLKTQGDQIERAAKRKPARRK